jgi:hypothetical protein
VCVFLIVFDLLARVVSGVALWSAVYFSCDVLDEAYLGRHTPGWIMLVASVLRDSCLKRCDQL